MKQNIQRHHRHLISQTLQLSVIWQTDAFPLINYLWVWLNSGTTCVFQVSASGWLTEGSLPDFLEIIWLKCGCMIFISLQCINWASMLFLSLLFYLWGTIGTVRDRALGWIEVQSKSTQSCISSWLLTLRAKKQVFIFLQWIFFFHEPRDGLKDTSDIWVVIIFRQAPSVHRKLARHHASLGMGKKRRK